MKEEEKMAVNNEVILSWSFLKKVEPDKAMKEILVEGEEILQCYLLNRKLNTSKNKIKLQNKIINRWNIMPL